MNFQDALVDFGGLIIGLILTLFVFSYVYKDNPLYRFAVHLLVGVSAGFAAVVVIEEIFIPFGQQFGSDPFSLANLINLVPIFLASLLLFKAVPRLSWLGNSSMAALISVGASVGLVGAVAGTLIPQTLAKSSSGLLGIVAGLITICVLAYFYFYSHLGKGRKQTIFRWLKPVRFGGRLVITMALAGVFAGLLATSLVLLTERVGYFINSFIDLFETLLS